MARYYDAVRTQIWRIAKVPIALSCPSCRRKGMLVVSELALDCARTADTCDLSNRTVDHGFISAAARSATQHFPSIRACP